ncbi:MAG: nucleotide pyrophosphohydrolase [Candidatus Bathyarchaeia archaeon]
MRLSSDRDATIHFLKEAVRAFVQERGWDRFHNAKNLAESICIESSELLELFQWLSSRESQGFIRRPQNLSRLSGELADVLIYCLALANLAGVDIASSILSKLRESARRYPAHEYSGRAPRLGVRSGERPKDSPKHSGLKART